jgi:hypothetical protein
MPSVIFNKVGFSHVHYESCAMGIGIPPSESQLWGTLQMKFLVCNDIETSEHVLSMKLEGYYGVFSVELSIWAAQ